MPLLDVSDAFDPQFLDTVFVDRIVQTINQYGRAVRHKTRYTVPDAVVTASSPDDLQRLPDYERMEKAITVYSPTFRFQGPVHDPVNNTFQTMPDEIIWHGSTFVVRSMQDYSGYGRGFTSVIAVSILAVDAPPIGGGITGTA